jgi:hypothetical protein
MYRMLIAVVANPALVVAASALSAPSTELEFIRSGHRASRDAIRTVHATYEVQRWLGAHAQECSGTPDWVSKMEWWQDGEKIRWKETVTTSDPGKGAEPTTRWTFDRDNAVWEGTATRIESQRCDGKERLKGATLSSFDPTEPIPDDLWDRASFALALKPHHTVAELLDVPERVVEVEATEVRGTPYYRTRILFPDSKKIEIEVWIDPKHNFLVKKWGWKPMAGETGFRNEHEVLSFRECEPSVYFPQETRVKSYWIGEDGSEKLRAVSRTRFRSVEINRPIDPETFVLAVPSGLSVVDLRNGTRYRLGPDGNPADLRPAPVAAKDPVFESVAAQRRGMERWHFWTVVGVSLLLGAGVTAFLVRKRRRPVTGSRIGSDGK